jgi:F-type H+-transporting ATPase subunit b
MRSFTKAVTPISRVLAALFLAFCMTGVPTSAQEHPAPEQRAVTEHQDQAAAPAHAAAANGEQKEDSLHETEQAMKRSASVRAFGKALGIQDPNTAYWLFWTLNFLVAATAIAALMRRKLPGFFSQRTAAIQKGIEEARKISAESSARLSVIEARLTTLDTEIASMREQAEQERKAEEDRLRAATEEEKRKILDSAEQEIAAATNVARRDLKNYAAELAVDLAKKRIAVSESADQALVKQFAESLGNGSGGRS